MAPSTCSSAMPDSMQQTFHYSGSIQFTNGENRESIPFQHHGGRCSDGIWFAYDSLWKKAPRSKKSAFWIASSDHKLVGTRV